MTTEYLLYGIAAGDTEHWQEQLLTCTPSVARVWEVRAMALRDGFHSFRLGQRAITEHRIHKGIAYFPDFKDAQRKAGELADGAFSGWPLRIVHYDRGYAVQYHASGPYWPEEPRP